MKKHLVVLAAAGVSAGQSGVLLDYTPTAGEIGPFSDAGIATWGQTFQVPTTEAATLDRFGFTLRADSPGEFKFYVAAWDGAKAIGPALYESSALFAYSGYNDYALTPAITLEPGVDYVAFVNNSSFRTTGGALRAGLSYSALDYQDGALVYQQSGVNLNSAFNSPWELGLAANYDLAFQAQFTAVPELPVGWAALALVAVAGVIRRRLPAKN